MEWNVSISDNKEEINQTPKNNNWTCTVCKVEYSVICTYGLTQLHHVDSSTTTLWTFLFPKQSVWLIFIYTILHRSSCLQFKQCRPWLDDAFYGIWSGSVLFASYPVVGSRLKWVKLFGWWMKVNIISLHLQKMWLQPCLPGHAFIFNIIIVLSIFDKNGPYFLLACHFKSLFTKYICKNISLGVFIMELNPCPAE